MSQEALASAASLDRTYISQLERGHKSPTLTTLAKLAECLNTTVQTLLTAPAVGSPAAPADYLVRRSRRVAMARLRPPNDSSLTVPPRVVLAAVNFAHALIDDLYRADLDIAAVLGLRNLSAFVGELFATGLTKASGDLLAQQPASGRTSRLAVDGRSWAAKLAAARRSP